MFTGIVTQRARVTSVVPGPGGKDAEDVGIRLSVRFERELAGLAVGDSLALDGVCLTAVEAGRECAAFDVVPETLRRTTLGRLRTGDAVNVEPALRMGDPLGGHLVQGHVDGVGRVTSVERRGDDVRMEFELPETLRGATLAKGSIAVDGVSLTVGESAEDRFSVYLVPHTLAVTGLRGKKAGDAVNLEADVVGRYVEHHVRRVLGQEPFPAAREGAR